MKLTVLLLTAAFLNVHASGFSQAVTLQGNNLPLKKVISIVEQQTGYVFFYTKDLLKNTAPVTVAAADMPLEEFLDVVLKSQMLSFRIADKTIMLSRKTFKVSNTPLITAPQTLTDAQNIIGRVVHAKTNEPLLGATVTVAGTEVSVVSDNKGQFSINADVGSKLIITYVGFQSKEIKITTTDVGVVLLEPIPVSLSEVVVNKGYYTTTERLNTGSVSKVTSEQISRQPISNPLAALQGQVPGLAMYQESGLPGSDVVINIRGLNSISQGSTPLFVIDGVPIAASTGYSSGSYRTISGSVFTAINPNNIESIEVLKDADATSIYGSKGANGVVLITTKKGKSGKTTLDLKAQRGMSVKAYEPQMLNTAQYLALRRKAFRNDGVEPTIYDAPDLLVWDTTKNKDWMKEVSGQTAQTTDVQLNITGGTKGLQFILGTGYHRETTPLATTRGYSRGTMHFNVSHQTPNDRFKISVTGDYTTDKNQLPSDVLTFLNVLRSHPPNAPEPFDDQGNLVWTPGLTNPYAMLMRTSTAKSHNISGSTALSYQLARGLTVKVNAGSNNSQLRTEGQSPRSSFDPDSDPDNFAFINAQEARSWIVEPQVTYNMEKGRLKVDALAGGTFQNQFSRIETIQGNSFANDKLLNNMSAAGSVSFSNSFSQYRYQAFFSRLGFNVDNKYVLNLSGRRDGSSRFGPRKRFSIFGAVGAAWIFSDETALDKLSWLSFGKLRASYGTTGNDQIGDYQYLDTWSRDRLFPYQGTSVMVPDQLFNPDYVWELSRKMDLGLDLGFWQNKLFFTLNYYRNRSSNQLTSLSLPNQTGFYNITVNQDAVVSNTGLEMEIRSTNLDRKNLKWTTSFNIAIPRNKLISYPGVEDNSLKYSYVVGQRLGASWGYQYLGVNPESGLYSFLDVNKDDQLSYPEDYVFLEKTAKGMVYNGGLTNNLKFRNFEIDVFFNFIHQYKPFSTLAGWFSPGIMENMPAAVLDNIWRKPGDRTDLQRATASTGSDAYSAAMTINSSDGGYGISSYVRLRNLSLAYNFPSPLMQKLHVQNARVFLTGQNLFTFSPYKGADPEVEMIYYMSNLKTFSAGFQVSF